MSEAQTEVSRLTSPDSHVDAILVEVNAGATTSYYYEVYIAPRGQKPGASKDAVLVIVAAGDLRDLVMTWRQPKLVQISYKHGWIRAFTNRWSEVSTVGGSYVVELKLIPPEGDTLALPPTLRF
jgi:hypothetical protein